MTILLFFTFLFIAACVLDILSSQEMTKYGIKESVPLVRDKNGNFSLVKALFFVIGPLAVIWAMYLFGPETEEASGYDRGYAGYFLLIGVAAHALAWWSNRRKIAKARQNTVSRGGIG